MGDGSLDDEFAPTLEENDTKPEHGLGCKPCYSHIKGKCKNGTACAYCHAPEHAIRRKQRKHQRKVMKTATNACSGSALAAPDVPPMVMTSELVPRHAVGSSCVKCRPCWKYIKNKCLLGGACAYFHDPLHKVAKPGATGI